MKKVFLILILVFVTIILSADYAESFLSIFPTSIGEGTRGNLYSYSDNTNPMFFYNPANSSTDISDKIFIGYEHKFLYSNISHFNSASFIMPTIRSVRIGFGYINQIISGIPIYPEYSDTVSFEPRGYFSDNAHCILLNVSYIYTNDPISKYEIAGGLNIKSIIHSIYENMGIGAGLDLGINNSYKFNTFSEQVPSKVYLGFVLKDIGGTKITWDTDSKTTDTREMMYGIGLSYSSDIRIAQSQIFLELNYSNREGGTVGFSFIYKYNQMIGVFAGENEYINADIGYTQREIGGGCFIDILGFGIYYGISKSEIGFNNSVSIRYRV